MPLASSEQPIPDGYEVVHGRPIRGLLLPNALAEMLEQEQDAEEQRQRKERERQNRERQAGEERPEPTPPDVPEQPPAGHHRVLPDFEAVLRSLGEAEVVARSPDAATRERLVEIGRRLADLGPDRAVGMPGDWRRDLDDLAMRMPNFKVVIERVRHALALAEATGAPPRIPPLLLLGPPGVGKTLFSQQLAQVMRVPFAEVAFDQPSYGATLRGSDKAWSNSEAGLLFNLICLGSVANPVILLDELDKSTVSGSRHAQDPLAQLHGALEPLTARRTKDLSVEVTFDASLVTYVATANHVRGIGLPLLGRFEIFAIEPSTRGEAVQVARLMIEQVLGRLQLQQRLRFDAKCAYVLATMSPRRMQRSIELLAGMALDQRHDRVREADCWEVVGGPGGPRLH